MHFTKCIRGMWNIAYRDRLQMLNLESLEERRIKNDIIYVYKMFNNLLQFNVDEFFEKCTFTTRGHVCKLRRPFRRLSLTHNFFTYRLISRWNAMPLEICSARNVRIFKQVLVKAVLSNNLVWCAPPFSSSSFIYMYFYIFL